MEAAEKKGSKGRKKATGGSLGRDQFGRKKKEERPTR